MPGIAILLSLPIFVSALAVPPPRDLVNVTASNLTLSPAEPHLNTTAVPLSHSDATLPPHLEKRWTKSHPNSTSVLVVGITPEESHMGITAFLDCPEVTNAALLHWRFHCGSKLNQVFKTRCWNRAPREDRCCYGPHFSPDPKTGTCLSYIPLSDGPQCSWEKYGVVLKVGQKSM